MGIVFFCRCTQSVVRCFMNSLQASSAATCKLIGQLLDEFRVEEACQVSAEYGCTTQDVVIIQVNVDRPHMILLLYR